MEIDKLTARLFIRTYADDPADATVARKIAWVPMGKSFTALAVLISGTGVLTFKIFAATDGNGSNPTEVKAHATPTVADAAGDQLVLSVNREEVLAVLAHASHVSVEIDNDANTDINAITYVVDPMNKFEDQTADVIA